MKGRVRIAGELHEIESVSRFCVHSAKISKDQDDGGEFGLKQTL
jgi:hypothetical protein